ncbi:MAG: hypothetical protein JSR21_21460 [Proteobacteria bacterium]|nr:hypothetical protein [Pseudomonadota bacterium]
MILNSFRRIALAHSLLPGAVVHPQATETQGDPRRQPDDAYRTRFAAAAEDARAPLLSAPQDESE